MIELKLKRERQTLSRHLQKPLSMYGYYSHKPRFNLQKFKTLLTQALHPVQQEDHQTSLFLIAFLSTMKSASKAIFFEIVFLFSCNSSTNYR